MEKIEDILEEDEKILWKRSKIRNLLYFFPSTIYFIICYNFVTLLLFFFLITWNILLSLMIIFLIGYDGFSVIYVIYSYEKMKKRLQLSNKELKRYEEFEIITNKHFIRKDYFLNFNKEFLKYSKGVVKKIGDIVFLNLDLIQEVWVSHYQEKIFLKVNINEGVTNFYLWFKNHEDDEIIKAFKEVRKDIPIYGEEKFIIEKD